MRKIKLVYILGIICLFFFGGEMKVNADTLYQTDFSSLTGWDTGHGTWSNEDGQLTANGDQADKAILKDKDFSNFEYNTEVTVSQQKTFDQKDTGLGSGLLFRVQSLTEGVNGFQGYYFGIDLADQQVVLGRSDGSTWTPIATKKMTLKTGKTYQLKVKASGKHIQCFVDYDNDDYPRIDVIDEQYPKGAIGERSAGQKAAFDNVAVSSYTEQAPTGSTYQNPILPEVADPDVLYHNGTYYLYGTTPGREVGGIKVYTSTDLTNWTDKGLAMKMGPKNWGASGFWAPDLIERDGKFYMYYTANEHLCVAVSDSPLGPFEQTEVGPMHWDTKEIDAHVFKDDDGQYYIYFVRFTDGNVIWGAKLNDDMRSLDEKSLTKLLVPSQPWEQDMARVNEGPYMLKKDGIYYLTYSGAHFESPMYGSGYATSKSPLGPYQKYQNNPIMQSNSIVHGTGHHGITVSPDGQEMFMVYHRHLNLNQSDPRQFAIDRLRFAKDEEGQTILEVHGPTVTQQATPSGSIDADNFIEFAPLETKEITVAKGSDPSKWKLPQFVGVRTSKSAAGKDQQLTIRWNRQEYDPNSTNTQIIHGSVALPNGIRNLGQQNLTVTMNVKTTQKPGEPGSGSSDSGNDDQGQQGPSQGDPGNAGHDQETQDQTNSGQSESGQGNQEQMPDSTAGQDDGLGLEPNAGNLAASTATEPGGSSKQNSGLLPQTGEFFKNQQHLLVTAALMLLLAGGVLFYRRKRH